MQRQEVSRYAADYQRNVFLYSPYPVLKLLQLNEVCSKNRNHGILNDFFSGWCYRNHCSELVSWVLRNERKKNGFVEISVGHDVYSRTGLV